MSSHDDSDIEDVSSDPAVPKVYSQVPANTQYKMKIGTKKFSYTLKEGRPLPHNTIIKGE